MTTKKAVKKPAKAMSKVSNKESALTVTQTDASKVKDSLAITFDKTMFEVGTPENVSPVFHATHAESVQAAEEGNKEAVAEIIPAQSVLEVARAAWAEVKSAGDPAFDACVPTHREKFISHAEAILRGNSPQEGDTQLARFERAVSARKGE